MKYEPKYGLTPFHRIFAGKDIPRAYPRAEQRVVIRMCRVHWHRDSQIRAHKELVKGNSLRYTIYAQVDTIYAQTIFKTPVKTVRPSPVGTGEDGPESPAEDPATAPGEGGRVEKDTT